MTEVKDGIINLKSLLRQPRPNIQQINDYLKSLSPSGIELEFLSLSTFDLDNKSADGVPLNYVLLMLNFFHDMIRSKQDSDFTQSMLNCFLKTHYDAIMHEDDESGELISKVHLIQEETERSFSDLESLIDHNLCMVSHFTGIQINWTLSL